jgi:hypothetical protein
MAAFVETENLESQDDEQQQQEDDDDQEKLKNQGDSDNERDFITSLSQKEQDASLRVLVPKPFFNLEEDTKTFALASVPKSTIHFAPSFLQSPHNFDDPLLTWLDTVRKSNKFHAKLSVTTGCKTLGEVLEEACNALADIFYTFYHIERQQEEDYILSKDTLDKAGSVISTFYEACTRMFFHQLNSIHKIAEDRYPMAGNPEAFIKALTHDARNILILLFSMPEDIVAIKGFSHFKYNKEHPLHSFTLQTDQYLWHSLECREFAVANVILLFHCAVLTLLQFIQRFPEQAQFNYIIDTYTLPFYRWVCAPSQKTNKDIISDYLKKFDPSTTKGGCLIS